MGQRAASTNERLMHTRAGVQHAAKTRGATHEQPRDALGRLWLRAAMPPHPCAMCGETSGGGPGEGFLADTGRCNGRWVCRKFQVLEDLPDDLPVRDGRDNPQRPPLTPGAA